VSSLFLSLDECFATPNIVTERMLYRNSIATRKDMQNMLCKKNRLLFCFPDSKSPLLQLCKKIELL